MAGDDTIRRFEVNVPQAALDDLRRRIESTRVFRDEIYSAPRTCAEKAYPNLIHHNRIPKGGHFAAWEQPAAFSEEVRAAFRSLR